MKPTFRIVSRIYEGTDRYPVVVHVFYGRTRDIAERVFKAHQQTDSFLRGCMQGGFKKINCHEEHETETLQGTRWVRVYAPR